MLKRHWRTIVVFSIALAVTIVEAQTLPRTADIGQKQLAVLLREPLPAHARPDGSPAFYNPENLYQQIDGGADIYLLYDFKQLLHQDFKSAAADVTVDIYEMGTIEDAFGIYAAERSPAYKFAPVGAEGYRDRGLFNFLQDRFYVKLSGSGANVDAVLDEFVRLLSQRIGGVRTFPALLQKLPREHRVLHSEQYVRKDPLGHAFLAPAYVVAYAQGKQESKLVVSVAHNPQEAKLRSQQLTKHFQQSGECSLAPELGEGGIRANNHYEGRLIARTQGRYLITLLNPSEDGAAILKETARSLP